MRFTNKIFFFKILILVFTIFILMFFSYLNFSFNKYPEYTKRSFYIKPGDSVSESIKSLKEYNIIDSSFRFKILSYLYSIKPKFIKGKYKISSYDTEYNILKKVLNGNLYQETITIIEGLTFSEILTILKNTKHISFSNNKYVNNTAIKALSPEGLCFPDTYKFSSGITKSKFLTNCQKEMEKILMKYWNLRDYSLPYKSPYEMLIMASIIEKETFVDSEKPLIASVFVNRLNKKMRLQADPTVIYGMKNYKGNITKKDLQTKNEYNTYKINGLPKTPICSPGESSIKSASKPAKSEFLYFVSNNQGKHIFSKNYKDHVKAVNMYQKK